MKKSFILTFLMGLVLSFASCTGCSNGDNTGKDSALIDTISSGRLKDEKLMELTLGTTEDINQTLSREEDFKTGNRPKKFTSYFILNEIIPNKNNMRTRAKSEKKKVSLNPKNNFKNVI